jgi:hypothetical protein
VTASPIPRSNTTRAAIAIKRLGDKVIVRKPDGSATENKYGKVETNDVTYTDTEETYARRVYRFEDEFPAEAGVVGGRVDTDTPRILLPKDVEVNEEWRVHFINSDETYVLDEEIHREIMHEYPATLVSDT